MLNHLYEDSEDEETIGIKQVYGRRSLLFNNHSKLQKSKESMLQHAISSYSRGASAASHSHKRSTSKLVSLPTKNYNVPVPPGDDEEEEEVRERSKKSDRSMRCEGQLARFHQASKEKVNIETFLQKSTDRLQSKDSKRSIHSHLPTNLHMPPQVLRTESSMRMRQEQTSRGASKENSKQQPVLGDISTNLLLTDYEMYAGRGVTSAIRGSIFKTCGDEKTGRQGQQTVKDVKQQRNVQWEFAARTDGGDKNKLQLQTNVINISIVSSGTGVKHLTRCPHCRKHLDVHAKAPSNAHLLQQHHHHQHNHHQQQEKKSKERSRIEHPGSYIKPTSICYR